ncbi:MAG: DUF2339 domain-containing protein [Bacteroidales bacterium]|nr:DUF2339 domain-containing protein [Bacteroidales bacterium]
MLPTENEQRLEKRIADLEQQVSALRERLNRLDIPEETPLQTSDSPILVPDSSIQIPDSTILVTDSSIQVPDSTIQVPGSTIQTEQEQPCPDASCAPQETPAEIDPIDPIEPIETIESIDPPASSAPQSSPSEHISWEEKIGKRLIPIAGSALIIFALILFGSLIQPRLTDMMKAILMGVVSLSITAVGIWRMRRPGKYSTFFSALAGCGAAGCYVSTLVSHFVLGVLPESILMVCIIVWIIAMILLSKIQSKIFTYICYVGILIAAYMTVQRWCDSVIGLFVYMISIKGLLLANYSSKYKTTGWIFAQIPLVMIPMADTYSDYLLPLVFIYLGTLIPLFAQIPLYQKELKDSWLFFATTALSLIAFLCCATGCDFSLIHYSLPTFGNHWGWGITTCITLIGLTLFYGKMFGHSSRLFYLVAGTSLLVIPMLNYGSFYHGWCANTLVPGIVLLIAGWMRGNHRLSYIAHIYLLLFTLSGFASGTILTYTPAGNDGDLQTCELSLQCGVFIYIALLAAHWYWQSRHHHTGTQYVLQFATAWSIILLYTCHWIDIECCYLLLCITLLLMVGCWSRFTLFRISANLQSLYVALPIVLGISSIPVRILNAFFGMNGHELIWFDNDYANPIIGLAGAMLVWGIGHWLSRDKVKKLGYWLYAIHLLFSFDFWRNHMAEDIFVGLLYLAALAVMIRCTYLRYRTTDKLVCTALLHEFFWAILISSFYEAFEAWALSSLLAIGCCTIPWFQTDPHTHQAEKSAHQFSMLATFILLLVSSYFLFDYHDCLHINGKRIEGSEPVVSILLVILVLALSCINLKRSYHFSENFTPWLCSLYNGLKLTWALYAILYRFSTVPYIISLSGILLAILLIFFGFRNALKGLRQYGLALTILCVVKLIFFDIVFDNAFYRPISFLVAGLLLFLISFIYIRLEKSNKSD